MAPRKQFDWEKFLRRYKIDFDTRGSSVVKGNVAIQCPFCGASDRGKHMSVSTRGRGWKCWRNAAHAGGSPVYLIRELIRCTVEEAMAIAGHDAPTPAPAADEVADTLSRIPGISRPEPAKTKQRLAMPRSFYSLLADDDRADRFYDYMLDRGYREREIEWLTETYDLHWTTVGGFSWRLILPIKDRRGNLETWTGRAISAEKEPRYKTLSERDGPALLATGSTLLGLDQLWHAPDPRVLVICEGPFDALRISASGAPLGVWATCLFGLNLSADQRELLLDLAERFPRICLMLDATETLRRLSIARELHPTPIELHDIPAGVKDPGELSAAQATELCMSLLT